MNLDIEPLACTAPTPILLSKKPLYIETWHITGIVPLGFLRDSFADTLSSHKPHHKSLVDIQFG